MRFGRVQRAGWGVTAFVAVCGCAGANVGSAPEGASPGRPDDAQIAELEALFQARTDSARMRFTEADVSFMQGMIGHHAQALVMSELAPDRAGSASLRILAARTINAQGDEIETMRGWLQERGQAVPELMVHGVAHDPGSMPGMLTLEQMQELEAARGADFDRLFLTYMVQHHSGAVAMVHELFATDGAAQGDAVFKIASDIQVDQLSEIDRMESMLEDPDGF